MINKDKERTMREENEIRNLAYSQAIELACEKGKVSYNIFNEVYYE